MYFTREPLHKNSKSKFILVKDAAKTGGLRLLKAIVNTVLNENVDVSIIYYELACFSLLSSQNVGNGKVIELDKASDPFGWNKSTEETDSLRSVHTFGQLCFSHKGVICMDSLSPLLFNNCCNSVYKMLHKVLKENADLQIFALMHTDVHDAYENQIIEMLATTVLYVDSDDESCSCTIRYPSGKVSSLKAEYHISDLFHFSHFREFQPQVKSTSVKQPDPTANLTFNLRLKESEIKAKSQLQLPYVEMQNKDVFDVEIDMYDEEDPDDDLDI